MQTEKEFEESFAIQTWLKGLPNKKVVSTTRKLRFGSFTKYRWMGCMKRFCEFTGKTPDELIAMRKAELKDEGVCVKHSMEMRVKQFLAAIAEQGKGSATQKTYYTAINNFFTRNYQRLDFFRGDKPKAISQRAGARAATKEEIRAMVEVAKPRIRALILFLKDTGLSAEDAGKLRLGDLGVKDVSGIFTLDAPVPLSLAREKTGARTLTFIGREALESIKTMLRIRVAGNPDYVVRGRPEFAAEANTLNHLFGPETLTLESPLFRGYRKENAQRNKTIALSASAISMTIRKAARAVGVWQEGFSAHALRRYFQTSLESAGVSRNWVQLMMGHTLEGVEGSYSKPTEKMLQEAYEKSYSHLAITEVAENRSRVEFLEKEVARLSMNGHSKAGTIDDLQKQVNEMRDTLELIREGKMSPHTETITRKEYEEFEEFKKFAEKAYYAQKDKEKKP